MAYDSSASFFSDNVPFVTPRAALATNPNCRGPHKYKPPIPTIIQPPLIPAGIANLLPEKFTLPSPPCIIRHQRTICRYRTTIKFNYRKQRYVSTSPNQFSRKTGGSFQKEPRWLATYKWGYRRRRYPRYPCGRRRLRLVAIGDILRDEYEFEEIPWGGANALDCFDGYVSVKEMVDSNFPSRIPPPICENPPRSEDDKICGTPDPKENFGGIYDDTFGTGAVPIAPPAIPRLPRRNLLQPYRPYSRLPFRGYRPYGRNAYSPYRRYNYGTPRRYGGMYGYGRLGRYGRRGYGYGRGEYGFDRVGYGYGRGLYDYGGGGYGYGGFGGYGRRGYGRGYGYGKPLSYFDRDRGYRVGITDDPNDPRKLYDKFKHVDKIKAKSMTKFKKKQKPTGLLDLDLDSIRFHPYNDIDELRKQRKLQQQMANVKRKQKLKELKLRLKIDKMRIKAGEGNSYDFEDTPNRRYGRRSRGGMNSSDTKGFPTPSYDLHNIYYTSDSTIIHPEVKPRRKVFKKSSESTSSYSDKHKPAARCSRRVKKVAVDKESEYSRSRGGRNPLSRNASPFFYPVRRGTKGVTFKRKHKTKLGPFLFAKPGLREKHTNKDVTRVYDDDDIRPRFIPRFYRSRYPYRRYPTEFLRRYGRSPPGISFRTVGCQCGLENIIDPLRGILSDAILPLASTVATGLPSNFNPARPIDPFYNRTMRDVVFGRRIPSTYYYGASDPGIYPWNLPNRPLDLTNCNRIFNFSNYNRPIGPTFDPSYLRRGPRRRSVNIQNGVYDNPSTDAMFPGPQRGISAPIIRYPRMYPRIRRSSRVRFLPHSFMYPPTPLSLRANQPLYPSPSNGLPSRRTVSFITPAPSAYESCAGDVPSETSCQSVCDCRSCNSLGSEESGCSTSHTPPNSECHEVGASNPNGCMESQWQDLRFDYGNNSVYSAPIGLPPFERNVSYITPAQSAYAQRPREVFAISSSQNSGSQDACHCEGCNVLLSEESGWSSRSIGNYCSDGVAARNNSCDESQWDDFVTEDDDEYCYVCRSVRHFRSQNC